MRELSVSVLEDNHLVVSPAAVAPGVSEPPTVAARILILLSLALPVMGLVALFSVAGYGDVVYIGLSSWEWPWYSAAAVDLMLIAVLWMFDANAWKRPGLVLLRQACMVVLVVFAGIACMLAAKVYPFAPLQFGMLLVPACAFLTRHLALPHVAAAHYMTYLSLCCALTAVSLAMYFVLWMYVLPPPPRRFTTGWNPEWHNVWGGDVKHYWRGRLGCEPYNRTSGVPDTDCYDAAFLWWSYPLLIAIALGFGAGICRFLGRGLATTHASAEAGAIRLFALVVAAVALSMYVAASIAGAGLGLSDLVRDGALSLLGATLVLVGCTLGWANFARIASEQPWVRRALSYMNAMREWCVALLFCAGVVPLCAYLGASFLKQLTRKARGANRLKTGGDDARGHLTAEAVARLRRLSDVHWGSVASKVALLNLIYLTLFVIVGKFVIVFLAALNMWLAPLPLGATFATFLLVGIAMFLIPVIPGVPVYMLAGVILPSALMSDAERADESSGVPPASFWVGLLLACALSCVLKFVAIVLQQEVIGRRLGERIGVRAACQVNSTFIRAARFVLVQPGCTFGKTMILCGGPDWPTSVLTGILRLSVLKMLLGSAPVVIIIVPCCMLGACMVMANRPGWEIITQLVALLAGAAQLAASLAFAAVIERAAAVHEAAIAALPYDEEVRALDDERAAYAFAWRRASDWSADDHPRMGRAVLVAAAAASTLAVHVSVLLRCFERVTVADPFDGAPLHGNPLNVVAGAPGWFVLVALLLTSGLVYGHGRWLAGRTRRIIAQSPSAGYGDRLGTDSGHLAAGQQRAAMGPGGGDSGL